jgi:hypothetical protein
MRRAGREGEGLQFSLAVFSLCGSGSCGEAGGGAAFFVGDDRIEGDCLFVCLCDTICLIDKQVSDKNDLWGPARSSDHSFIEFKQTLLRQQN